MRRHENKIVIDNFCMNPAEKHFNIHEKINMKSWFQGNYITGENYFNYKTSAHLRVYISLIRNILTYDRPRMKNEFYNIPFHGVNGAN